MAIFIRNTTPKKRADGPEAVEKIAGTVEDRGGKFHGRTTGFRFRKFCRAGWNTACQRSIFREDKGIVSCPRSTTGQDAREGVGIGADSSGVARFGKEVVR